ncbi:MAG TPA: hypothetical protein GXX67_09690 [Petrimonas sp.]|nr:hypothetical protein [Petrimonas sp.]
MDLQNSDSYHFFRQISGHIITGNTGTNVMDMEVLLTCFDRAYAALV